MLLFSWLLLLVFSSEATTVNRLSNFQSIWDSVSKFVRGERNETPTSVVDLHTSPEPDTESVISKLSLPKSIRLVDGVMTAGSSTPADVKSGAQVKASMTERLQRMAVEASPQKQGRKDDQLPAAAAVSQDLLRKLQLPRTVKLVDGVMVEETKPQAVRGKDASHSDLLSKLSLPRRLRMVDDVLVEEGKTGVHHAHSESGLNHLGMPKRLHSMDDVLDVVVPEVDGSVTEELSVNVGLDLFGEESISGKSGSSKRQGLKHLIVDEEELNRMRSGSRPNMYTDFERIPNGGLVTLDHHNSITTLTSSIFSVARNPTLIAKYQVDCFDTDREGIHPLLKDYWFLRRLSALKVTPAAFYLSNASPLPFRNTLKSGFRMTVKDRAECFRSGGKVRFMIMEKVGESLHFMSRRYPNGMVPLANVLSLGSKMIEMIRKLHDEGQVVHGDIHAGNICFSRRGSSSLRLIDFGRANLVTSAEDGVKPLNREPFTWSDPLLSHWNIEGYRETRRDDVFKIFIVMAMLMNGRTYIPHLKDTLTSQAAYEFKRDGNIFKIPGTSIEGWTERTESVLSEILAIVRATELDARPDYESILSKLSEL